MDRQVHRLFEMIALRAGNRVLAVTQANFRDVVERALPDLDALARTNYLLTFAELSMCLPEYRQQVPAWDAELVSAIQRRMVEFSDLLTFGFGPEEAQKYLPDLLEAYRGNHFGKFAWSVDEHLGTTGDRVLLIETYETQSFLSRLAKRPGAVRSRHAFNLSAVKSASGTAMRFVLECEGFALGFTPDGSVLRM